MLMIGALFVAVGYLLIVGALVLELTQFHPLLEDFFAQYTQHILVGIFLTLAAIIQVLSMVSHRLSYELERTQG